MTNRKLEARLRSIEEIKGERYVGTQESWNYLNRLAGLYEIPAQIAEDINRDVATEAAVVYYPATPEKIVGLYRALEQFFHDGVKDVKKHPFPPNPYGTIAVAVIALGLDQESLKRINAKEDSFVFNPWRGIFFDKPDVVGAMRLELTRYFMALQTPDMNDKTFGVEVGNAYTRLIPLYPDFEEYFLARVNGADWEKLLSKTNLSQVERELAGQIEGNALSEDRIFNLERRFRRMERDNVLRKQEYRRELIVDYIRLNGRDRPGGIKTYDDFVALIKNTLDKAKAGIEKNKQLGEDVMLRYSDNPDRMALLEFLAQPPVLESSERHFVDNFLRS